jgi:hypothetical protein
MAIRFYLDADLIGLAKLLTTVRSDVTYPGDLGGTGIDGLTRTSCAIATSTKDMDWIPIVSSSGWVVITRDRHMQHRPHELSAIKANDARIVTLDPRHALNKWCQLEIVVSQWRNIEDLAGTGGPWIYTASRTGLRQRL